MSTAPTSRQFLLDPRRFRVPLGLVHLFALDRTVQAGAEHSFHRQFAKPAEQQEPLVRPQLLQISLLLANVPSWPCVTPPADLSALRSSARLRIARLSVLSLRSALAFR
jgi:hypothetical protein